MKNIYSICALLCFPCLLLAQVNFINKGVYVKVKSSVNLRVNTGSITNKTNGQIINDGNIYLDADFTQNTAAVYTGNSSSWLWFEGAANQNLISDATLNISKLKVDNGNKLALGAAVIVSNSIDLNNNGQLELGTHNLVLSSGATITGYDGNNYIVTNNTGILQQEVGGTNVIFPIGNSSYNPAILNNSGVTDHFTARVFDQVYNQGTTGVLKTSNAPNRTWMIDENTVGGSNVSLTLQWTTTNEMPSFDRSDSGIARHLTGSSWDSPSSYTAATSAGTNVWTQTRSGITNFSPFVVHDSEINLPVELLKTQASYVNIYPNPVSDGLKISFKNLPANISSGKIQIIAVNGQILHQFTTEIQSHQTLEIDEVENLVPALYLLSIELDNGEKILQKFIKN